MKQSVAFARSRSATLWFPIFVVFGLTAVLVSLTATAESSALKLDPAKTRIEFTLHAVLHTVHGTFRLKSAAINFDPATGKADGRIVVDAASGNSGDSSRDARMHNEILESAKHPEITFMPVEVRGALSPQGISRVELKGILSLHGNEHELNIPVNLQANGERFSVDMKFDVPYVKWGLKNPSTFVLRVNDTVQINIHAIGSFVAPTVASAAPLPASPPSN